MSSTDPAAGDSVVRRVAWNTASQALGKLAVLVIGAASIFITTRYLGASGYGQFALALAFVQMVGLLADLGLLTVVVREISRDPGATERLIGHTLTLRLALSVVVIALAGLLSLAMPYTPQVRVAILIAGVPLVLGLVNTAIVASGCATAITRINAGVTPRSSRYWRMRPTCSSTPTSSRAPSSWMVWSRS